MLQICPDTNACPVCMAAHVFGASSKASRPDRHRTAHYQAARAQLRPPPSDISWLRIWAAEGAVFPTVRASHSFRRRRVPDDSVMLAQNARATLHMARPRQKDGGNRMRRRIAGLRPTGSGHSRFAARTEASSLGSASIRAPSRRWCGLPIRLSASGSRARSGGGTGTGDEILDVTCLASAVRFATVGRTSDLRPGQSNQSQKSAVFSASATDSFAGVRQDRN